MNEKNNDSLAELSNFKFDHHDLSYFMTREKKSLSFIALKMACLK